MESPGNYYLRVDIDDTADDSSSEILLGVELSGSDSELTFVDLHTRLRTPHLPGDVQIETLTGAVQDRLHLLSKTETVLFRWPWIVGPEDDPHIDQIEAWLRRLSSDVGGEPVLGSALRVGVLQHQVSCPPILRWSRESSMSDGELLYLARATELKALLDRRNAIWEPPNYHFRLPSGEHTDLFIRIADAINEPQDAYALACWLLERLKSGVGVVVDTGGLTPVLIQIESFLTRFELEVGPTAILQAYPAGRALVRHTVENALSEQSSGIVALLSVSATGSLKDTLLDELDRVVSSYGIDYTLDVMVDRSTTEPHSGTVVPDQAGGHVSWLNLKRHAGSGSSASCALCDSAEKAQLVLVDPRSYGSMALPLPHLVMPDTDHATAGQLFWERAAEYRARAIEAKPHPKSRIARGKRTALPVRPIFEVMCQPDGLTDLVEKRCGEHELDEGLTRTALVVAAPHDLDTVVLPAFVGNGQVDLKESARLVLAGAGIDIDVPVVSGDNQAALAERVAELSPKEAILVFSWGSVTGLTLRRLKLAVADVLAESQNDRAVNGLVFHARPSTPREWTAQQNQFQPGVLEKLWWSCFPWSSPLREESRLLDRSDVDIADLSLSGRNFLEQRDEFLGMHSTFLEDDDDWSPRFDLGENHAHPEHVFWGMSADDIHQDKVRGRSLYGKGLDCLSAYAAIGAVINFTRHNEQPKAAPRWVMFDMGRIVRSYFDAVITCSVIRWLHPGELWWAERDDPKSIRDSVAFLLDQTTESNEQVLLLPELLLASAQGKVPKLAHDVVRDKVQTISRQWPEDRSFDSARGAVEVGLRLLEAG
ncbi:MAG: hypothetical protein F4Y27_06420 [Acidimicrobiaceae bacterium]|nr:hypothetical protein [Acidimicrobiaceae bacterium]MXW76984.1 hypothetical protein [Acidimicrobiaceae bacterium]MYA74292.1 hypothetical protein [Acidimicrobiaceae bacterium]MYD05647.1 hypothetical protein [Acidimicrobiaceae bacterium]MYG55984.1 hypothetical protein [Acidimicrobiaceae bacterium]